MTKGPTAQSVSRLEQPARNEVPRSKLFHSAFDPQNGQRFNLGGADILNHSNPFRYSAHRGQCSAQKTRKPAFGPSQTCAGSATLDGLHFRHFAGW